MHMVTEQAAPILLPRRVSCLILLLYNAPVSSFLFLRHSLSITLIALKVYPSTPRYVFAPANCSQFNRKSRYPPLSRNASNPYNLALLREITIYLRSVSITVSAYDQVEQGLRRDYNQKYTIQFLDSNHHSLKLRDWYLGELNPRLTIIPTPEGLADTVVAVLAIQILYHMLLLGHELILQPQCQTEPTFLHRCRPEIGGV